MKPEFTGKKAQFLNYQDGLKIRAVRFKDKTVYNRKTSKRDSFKDLKDF